MIRRIALTVLLLASVVAHSQTSYLGMFLQGQRIGYSSSTTVSGSFAGGAVKRIDARTLLDAGLLGADMKTIIDASTFLDAAGNTLRIDFAIESAGRKQTTLAVFSGSFIELTINNNGAKTKKKLPLPKDAPVVDDAVNAMLSEQLPVGSIRHCYVLDPMTASLVKNTVEAKGETEITLPTGNVKANVIEVREPRATMRAYYSAKGDLLKIDGPMGIEMRPMTETEALAERPSGESTPDLADTTAIKLDKPIEDARSAKSITLLLQGADLALLPSDAFQTIRKEGSGWKVTVHPVLMNAKATIASAKKTFPQWTQPSLNIPSDTPEFKKLATKVLAGAKTVAEAAKRTRQTVFSIMKPNAGIGVLRDAGEVLKTKEGVCRDYAVLTASILRAANVPTRLASGLILMNGQYYYHAWAEVWDTKNWVGVDSTLPVDGVGADHLKLAHGNVEDAFTFTFLDKVKINVLNVQRR